MASAPTTTSLPRMTSETAATSATDPIAPIRVAVIGGDGIGP